MIFFRWRFERLSRNIFTLNKTLDMVQHCNLPYLRGNHLPCWDEDEYIERLQRNSWNSQKGAFVFPLTWTPRHPVPPSRCSCPCRNIWPLVTGRRGCIFFPLTACCINRALQWIQRNDFRVWTGAVRGGTDVPNICRMSYSHGWDDDTPQSRAKM